jgi:hypothetical protein
MKKIVKITENQLSRIVNKTLNEQFEMSDATPRRDFKSNPRERQLKDVFGSYSEDIPPVVLRYMRKNPKSIVQKLYDIYGDKMFDYIKPEFPLDEATEETINKTTYTKSDIDQAKQKGVGIDVKDGTVTPTEDGGMVVTSESDDLLDEDIFEEEKDIDNLLQKSNKSISMPNVERVKPKNKRNGVKWLKSSLMTLTLTNYLRR